MKDLSCHADILELVTSLFIRKGGDPDGRGVRTGLADQIG
jgi:hypothetical protein